MITDKERIYKSDIDVLRKANHWLSTTFPNENVFGSVEMTIAFIAGFDAAKAGYNHSLARLQQVIDHQRQEIGKLHGHLGGLRVKPDGTMETMDGMPLSLQNSAASASPDAKPIPEGIAGHTDAENASTGLKSPCMFSETDLQPYDSVAPFVEPEARTELLADAAENDDPAYQAHADKLAEAGTERYFDKLGEKIVQMQAARSIRAIIAELYANPYGPLAVAITTIVARHATVPIFGDVE